MVGGRLGHAPLLGLARACSMVGGWLWHAPWLGVG